MLYAYLPGGARQAVAAIPGGDLDPAVVPKYVTPLLIPPVMPRARTITMPGGKPADYYEISVRQFSQQILPAGMPTTTVWGYGAVSSASKKGLLVHHAPSLTIESRWNRPVRVKWINDLVNENGGYLRHLLPVDPTLLWANPVGVVAGRGPSLASEGEARSDDEREAYLGGEFLRFGEIADRAARGDLQADALHGLREQLTIFGLLDRSYLGTEELHVQFVEYA